MVQGLGLGFWGLGFGVYPPPAVRAPSDAPRPCGWDLSFRLAYFSGNGGLNFPGMAGLVFKNGGVIFWEWQGYVSYFKTGFVFPSPPFCLGFVFRRPRAKIEQGRDT